MVTIKDVAANAGVSIGTASRVLSGSEQTSPESRRKVLAAASSLDYIANGPARSLRRARTDVIGLLLSDIRNPFFSDLAHAAEQAARSAGFTVLLANADEDASQEQASLGAFASQRIDGLLIAPQTSDNVQFERLAATLPLVFVDRTVPGAHVPAITTDNAGGVQQALEHLHRRGHREVAYIGGPQSVSSARERLDAFLALRTTLGLSDDSRLVAEGDFKTMSGALAAQRVLDSGARPTAFLVADGLMTLGVIRALRDHPDAAEVVSFDDAPWFDFVTPRVSAIENDAAEIGRTAVRTLLDLISGRPVTSSRVPTRFINRHPDGGTR